MPRRPRTMNGIRDMKVQLLWGSGGEISAIKGEKKFSKILIKKK